MKVTTQLFPWPAGRADKGNWYREVQAQVHPDYVRFAKAGDLLKVRYPSGTTVEARILHVQRNLSSQHMLIQCEPTPGHRRVGAPISGTPVPADYEHQGRR